MLGNKIRQRENKPLYIQVSEELREEIITGVFAQDDKLPSIKDLAKQL
ncbi:MAG TPA: GntR family transcriptional regulator, partial [Firmicutes bacterium]|nr:GntR family transcriptional regulator [Bacillota bacterium]